MLLSRGLQSTSCRLQCLRGDGSPFIYTLSPNLVRCGIRLALACPGRACRANWSASHLSLSVSTFCYCSYSRSRACTFTVLAVLVNQIASPSTCLSSFRQPRLTVAAKEDACGAPWHNPFRNRTRTIYSSYGCCTIANLIRTTWSACGYPSSW